MATSSLLSVSRLLKSNSGRGMGARLHMQPPISAREIIRLASGTLLSGWELVTPKGIAQDEAHNVWHAGHVEDALALGTGAVLLATQTGGVWMAFPGAGSAPVALSNTWAQVDFRCLSLGSKGPHHIYAGGYNGTLYETQTGSLRAVARFLRSNSVRGMAVTLGIQSPISVRQLLDSTEAALFDWAPITLVDPKGASAGIGDIHQVVVVSGLQPAKIVLGTEQGVFWSDIPADGHSYGFVAAVGMPKTRCLGLALGSNNFVVASPKGNTSTANVNGIYKGDWESGILEMRRATHNGDIDFVQWNDAVVASSAGDRSRLYAAVSASGKATMSLREAAAKAGDSESPIRARNLAQRFGLSPPISLAALIQKIEPPQGADSLYAVLVSSDRGTTWAPCGPNGQVSESVRDIAFSQGGYDMSIAVSPTDTNTIAVGWRGGPWICKNSPTGFTFEQHGEEGTGSGASPHLHADVHGLHFDPHDSQGKTLYACTDGGVVFTRDLCATFDSSINAELANLQFQASPERSFGGSGPAGAGPSDVSVVTPGLAAGALQDNGVVFSFIASDGTHRPWQRHSGDEDGQLAILLKNNLLLAWTNTEPNPRFKTGPRARVARWTGDHFDPVNFANGIFVTVRTPSPTVSKGDFLINPIAEHVAHPAFENPVTKQQMFAIAANGSQGPDELWGLFADPDGSNAFWDFLGTVRLEPDENISAVGCDTGFTVLVGTTKGNISAFDIPSKRVFARTDSFNSPGESILQFSFLSDGAAVARLASGLMLFDPERLVSKSIAPNGLPIKAEGALYFMAIDNTTSPDTIYVATDFGVHASWDIGENWLPVSQGLPIRAHSSTLRFVEEPSGNRILYLFTYGRSAWRAKLS